MKLFNLLILFSLPILAQPSSGVTRVNSAPSGSCTNPQLDLVMPNGDLYSCVSGTWTKYAGGAGGGGASPASPDGSVQFRSNSTTFGGFGNWLLANKTFTLFDGPQAASGNNVITFSSDINNGDPDCHSIFTTNCDFPTPTAIGTTPGTVGPAVGLSAINGGNTTIVTTGIGGNGGGADMFSGFGATCPNAATGCTGGNGGLAEVIAGDGGSANGTSNTGTNMGGAGGTLFMSSGNGGSTLHGVSNTGGNAGPIILRLGTGGTGATANGLDGTVQIIKGARGNSDLLQFVANDTMTVLSRFNSSGVYTGPIPVNGTVSATNGIAGYNLYVDNSLMINQEQFLGAARFPALTGAVTTTAGSLTTSIAGVTTSNCVPKETSSGNIGCSGVTIDSSNNISTPGSITSGSGSGVAGSLGLGQGTAPSIATNTVTLYAPASVTGYNIVYPGAAASGIPVWSNSSNTVTMSIPTGFNYTQSTDSNLYVDNSSGNAILNLGIIGSAPNRWTVSYRRSNNQEFWIAGGLGAQFKVAYSASPPGAAAIGSNLDTYTPVGTLDVYDRGATTGATRLNVILGAADSSSTVTVTNQGTLKSAGYQSSDGSAGVTVTTCTSFKNGLCVAGT